MTVAISHIMTLITDVKTTVGYGVPFFYFSGGDFHSAQIGWIYGVLDEMVNLSRCAGPQDGGSQASAVLLLWKVRGGFSRAIVGEAL